MARSTGDGAYGGRGRRFDARMAVAIIVAIVLIVFVVLNTETTTVRLIFFEVNWPLWVVLALTSVVGFIVGWLVGRRRAPAR